MPAPLARTGGADDHRRVADGAQTSSQPVAGATPAAGTGRRAILTPELDLLLVGGLWILVALPLLIGGVPELLAGSRAGEALFWLTWLINVPHFMASYRLLYGSREQVRRHPWAAFYVPGLLAAWCVAAAVLAGRGDLRLLVALQGVSGIYLAWHYTGQAWGMMAVFAHVDGFTWSARERTLLRLGLRLLLAWHVGWFLRITGQTPAPIHEAAKTVAPLLDGLALLSPPLGLVAFGLLWRRAGRPPSVRAVAPWLAAHLWYLALWRTPARAESVAIVLGWVQIGHALQYLAFPARVELNRHASLEPARLAVHMFGYGALLLVVGVLVFDALPNWVLKAPVSAALGVGAGAVLAPLVVAAVNVHHFFTDGCVWKVSNPDVRRELLAHLPRPTAPASATAPAAVAPAPIAPPAPAA